MLLEAHAFAFAFGDLVAPAGLRLPVDVPGVTRVDFAYALAASGLDSGAEVGVEQGVYSEILCRANPRLRLLCVDAWQTYPGYREHVTQQKLDEFQMTTAARLAPYTGAGLIKGFSVEVARTIPDRSLDFVYLDANHQFAQVVADLAAWTPKVRSGGIVAGHDFRRSKGDRPFHVVEAVMGWTRAYQIRPWFVLRGDRAPSWYWVQR